mmetsp:Transcript_32551/g.92880  ORF Transcript_32551/g.92880 Transcript_32551/m.92880 type:complete len:217 (-) Transcript_32551:341-991(-)
MISARAGRSMTGPPGVGTTAATSAGPHASSGATSRGPCITGASSPSSAWMSSRGRSPGWVRTPRRKWRTRLLWTECGPRPHQSPRRRSRPRPTRRRCSPRQRLRVMPARRRARPASSPCRRRAGGTTSARRARTPAARTPRCRWATGTSSGTPARAPRAAATASPATCPTSSSATARRPTAGSSAPRRRRARTRASWPGPPMQRTTSFLGLVPRQR